MSELLTMKGFRRYKPENSIHPENVPHYMDDQGRDWYEWRYHFRDDTMKVVYDEDGCVVSFANSAEFMAPFDYTISEVPLSEVPEAFTIDDQHSWHYFEGRLVQSLGGRDSKIRALRESTLAATDFMMVPDYPLGDEKRAALTALRKSLRDITDEPGYPEVVFPELPDYVLDALRSKRVSLVDYNYLRRTV